ncbi:hypothetical protein LR48_Vigan07g110000 [Vigna angularis]|uniref:Uncharacterized protein n=1 Tax=Phaseolus angularis TaxID=3914 RepID=A0A0L9UXD8_PHAAN|nr:hypothetical protein LR48_Vigan07g110000 [Vigna angularis]
MAEKKKQLRATSPPTLEARFLREELSYLHVIIGFSTLHPPRGLTTPSLPRELIPREFPSAHHYIFISRIVIYFTLESESSSTTNHTVIVEPHLSRRLKSPLHHSNLLPFQTLGFQPNKPRIYGFVPRCSSSTPNPRVLEQICFFRYFPDLHLDRIQISRRLPI